MRKAQVSTEFIVIFTIFLFFFAILIGLFPDWIEKTAEARNLPQTVANGIKDRVITASLAESDFESNIIVPEKINGMKIRIDINKAPDNILTIKDNETGITLARVFLPKINETTGSPYNLNLTIKKTLANNQLAIIQNP